MSPALSVALLLACGDDASPSGTDSGTATNDAGTDGGIILADGAIPTTDAGVDAGTTDAGLAACTTFADAVERGTIENDELTEISGVVASRRQPRILFVHNDSGDSSRFFAIDDTGRHRGEFEIRVPSTDWEDIAIAPGPLGQYEIYLADTGDNEARTSMGARGRPGVQVYRVTEPDVPLEGEPVFEAIEAHDVLRFVYPDHPHDCEAIFVDPATGDLYFITKEDDGMSTVFRAAAPIATAVDITLEEVGSIAFGTASAPGAVHCTGADISPSGDAILARTYGSVLRWPLTGASIIESLEMPAMRLPAAAEPQGEAVAFAFDSRGYFTISEGAAAPVHFYACTE